MWTLSGFADEISAEAEQEATAQSTCMGGLPPRTLTLELPVPVRQPI
jgi:hypothetical protein